MASLLEQLTEVPLPMPLPEFEVVPDHMRIFMFSAITWNRHHIHYSKDAAVAEGLPDVVVQRALLGNYLARAVGDWAGDEADLRELSWKVRSSATPNGRLRCQGSVTAVHVAEGETFADCELRIVGDDDQLVVSGSARLALPDPEAVAGPRPLPESSATTSTGIVLRAARRGGRISRAKLYYRPYGTLLRSRARARHRVCLERAERSDSHTYTSFYRSPPQLAALTGPVVDHVTASTSTELSILVLAASNGSEAYTIASELIARRPDLAFSITASDLHEEMVAKGAAATYTMDEITQGLRVPADFIERTFDRVGDRYTVKEHIRSRVTFAQADLLDPSLNERFDQADIVVAQNVLFHMPPELAHRAFDNIVGFLKPRAALLVEGMELDMRVQLTRAAGLTPLPFKVKEIYEYSRRHIPENWWDYYYGNEPYSARAHDRSRRYGTIFLNG